MTPHFLDLDTIDTEITLVVKLKGVEHKMQPITIEDFISNMRTIEMMGTAASVEAEFKFLVDMLNRVFPTIGKDELWKLTLPQLKAMFDKAQEFGGANQVTDETKQALKDQGNENPPPPKS